jgi:hypothetical protein
MKKTYLITVITIIIVLALIISIFKPFLIIEEFMLNRVFSEDTQKRFAPNGKTHVGYCKIDLIRPIIYTIFNEKESEQYVIYSTISRDNIFSQRWKYEYEINYIGSNEIRNMDFDSAINFYEENTCEYIWNIKNNDDIIFIKPLSTEEIRAFDDSQQEIKEYQEGLKKKEEEYNALTTEEKIKFNEAQIVELNKAVVLLKQNKTFYEDGTPIDFGDLDRTTPEGIKDALYYYELYIKEYEDKNEELKK